MKRVGFQFKVRQDRLAEYKEQHKHVWPEMLDALRETGWHHYSLFMRTDGLIFGYFETDESLSVAQARMAALEINTRWQQLMAPFTDSNARPDESFVELEEYFHLD
jgi:L-rhamnose mutarotase